MKKIGTAVLLLAIFGLSARAQVRSDSSWHRPGMAPRHRHFNLTQQLQLSETQRKHVQALHQDFRSKLLALEKNEDISVREYRQQKAALVKERRQAFYQLLNKEQQQKWKDLQQSMASKREKFSEQRLQHLKAKLNLSEDQVTKIRQISSKAAVQARAIQQNDSLSRWDKRQQFMAIRKDQQQQVKTVLSPEQLQKMQEDRTQKMERSSAK